MSPYAPPRRAFLQRSWLALAALPLATSGCSRPRTLPEIRESRTSTLGAVLAIRLSNSPGSGSQSLAVPDGYLLLVKEDGTWVGIEVKSGSARRTPEQLAFDGAVSPDNPARVTLPDGRQIKITEIHVETVEKQGP